jgi:hypothetical protein
MTNKHRKPKGQKAPVVHVTRPLSGPTPVAAPSRPSLPSALRSTRTLEAFPGLSTHFAGFQHLLDPEIVIPQDPEYLKRLYTIVSRVGQLLVSLVPPQSFLIIYLLFLSYRTWPFTTLIRV